MKTTPRMRLRRIGHGIGRGIGAAFLGGSLIVATVAEAGAAQVQPASISSPSTTSKTAARQRVWPLHDFTRIELVPREAGANPNQQPLQVAPETLRRLLAQIQFVGRNGPEPLFAEDELTELAPPLAQALSRAGPGDDVLLLSASRRDAGFLASPTAITARLFVQEGRLQFIAHDARFEFYDTYRGTYVAPRFSFGSRTSAGRVALQNTDAASRRPDWLAISLETATATATPTQNPTSTAAPGDVRRPAAATSPSALPAAASPSRTPLDAAGADEIERRLETLKRLRDKGLITEDEYQQKRSEILQLL